MCGCVHVSVSVCVVFVVCGCVSLSVRVSAYGVSAHESSSAI